jgi:tRNA 2-thiouridine synthesizing protein C
VNTRRFLFLLRRASQGDVIDGELLDQILTLAAFDQAITVLFVDEGVYRLTSEVETAVSTLESGGLLALLAFYDIDSVWVEAESLVERGICLSTDQPCLKILPREAVAGMLGGHDVILGD